jgi:hypothetical protein
MPKKEVLTWVERAAMSRSANRRWWDWRVDAGSGQSIRFDDERGQEQLKKSEKASDWWWTLIGQESDCDGCGKHMPARQKVAYQRKTRKIYCAECARKVCVSTLSTPSAFRSEVGV